MGLGNLLTVSEHVVICKIKDSLYHTYPGCLGQGLDLARSFFFRQLVSTLKKQIKQATWKKGSKEDWLLSSQRYILPDLRPVWCFLIRFALLSLGLP